MGSEIRLRGRDSELLELEHGLGRAEGGRLVAVLVEGEAGIGKTALLDQLSGWASRAGFRVWRAKAEELERERPLGTIRSAIGSTATSLPVFTDLASGRVGSPPTDGWIEVPELGFRALDELIDLCDRETAAGPLALLVDDVQWIDELSLTALSAVTRRLADRALIVALACRPGHRDDQLAALLASVDDVVHLDVGPLDASAVDQLVVDVLGPDRHPAVSADAARGGGNPYFVLALLDALATQQRGPGDHRPTIPRSVRELVTDQLDGLERDTRQLVEVASVLGRPMTLGELENLSDLALPSLVSALDAAFRAGILGDEAGVLAFRHDLVRETVHDSMSPEVRSARHLDIGRRLRASDVAVSEVAAHFLRGAEVGDAEAARVLRQAARELGRAAPTTATELLSRALSMTPEDHEDHAHCQAELIESYVFSADLERGIRLAEQLLADAPPPDIELRLRNARSQVFFLQGHARRAATEFEAMAPLVAGLPRQAVVLADAAVSSMFAIDLERARALATKSLEVAHRHRDPIAPTLAYGVLAWIESLGGDLDRGLDLATRSVQSADDAPGLEGHRRVPHLFHAQVLLWADRLEEARSSLRRGQEISGELGMGWDEPMYQALLADERIRSGALDDALAEAAAGLTRANDVGSHFADGWLHAHRARVFLVRGDLDRSTAEVRSGFAGLAHGGGQALDQLWMIEGLIHAARGDQEAACEVLEQLWSKLEDLGAHLRQFELAPHLVRVVRSSRADLAESVTTATADRAERTPRALARTSVLWCRALAERDPTLALDAAALLAERGQLIELARCHGDTVDLLHEKGRDDEAAALRHEVDARLQRLVTARARDRGRDPDADEGGWAELTASEERIVTLVGEGLSNSEIATRLGISRRTVESHLYHAYPKLGLSSRVELAVAVSNRHA